MKFRIEKVAHADIPFGLNLKLSELTLYGGMMKLILRGVVPEELETSVASGTAYIGYRNSEIVGWAFYSPSTETAPKQRLDIFVNPKYRGKGYGRKLVKAVVADAPANVAWDVAPHDAAGVAVYTGAGIAVESPELPDMLDDTDDVCPECGIRHNEEHEGQVAVGSGTPVSTRRNSTSSDCASGAVHTCAHEEEAE